MSEWPRIDRIIQPKAGVAGEARQLQGVPTEGATLDNLYGCPALPAGYDTTAIVLLPAVSE